MWHLPNLSSSIDTRIKGTRVEYIFQDLINNSLYFPLSIIIYFYFKPFSSNVNYISYTLIIMFGIILQSYYIGTNEYLKKPKPLLGNLIGFSVYSIYISASIGFFPFVSLFEAQSYLLYSVIIGVSHEIRWRIPFERLKHFMILTDSLIHISAMMVLFWEWYVNSNVNNNASYQNEYILNKNIYYIVASVTLYGILMGMVNVNIYRYMNVLRKTATELREYSEWFLGAELLNKSVRDPSILNLKVTERTVLFVDIRGFSQWSSTNTPEVVVRMVNRFFKVSEKIFIDKNTCKVDLIGGEIMGVMETPESAVDAAQELMNTLTPVLRKEKLDIGIGINTGPLIEGLVGGVNIKKYSVMGDTVNIGKRICDVAGRGEILLAESTCSLLDSKIKITGIRNVEVKGITKILKISLLSKDTKIRFVNSISKYETPKNLILFEKLKNYSYIGLFQKEFNKITKSFLIKKYSVISIFSLIFRFSYKK